MASNTMPETNIGEQTRNEVKIAGQVVNMFKFPNKEITNTTIATSTGAKQNNPKITWYGEKSKTVADALTGKTKPCISITGYIQTSKSIRNGKKEYHQNIVGKSFTVEVIPKSGNEVTITGELTHKHNLRSKSTGERTGTVIRIKTGDKPPNYPEIRLFREQSEAAQTISLGSTVSIIGTIQTDKTTDPAIGKTLYRESIVGLELD